MGFWELLATASTPPLQVLLIAVLGALLATDSSGVLTADARRHLNKVVFYVFTPCLTFGSLARTVTLEDVISWWFMPVNIGVIFFCGSVLGWIVVKILKPENHLEGLVIASCSAGNLGNLMLILIPAVCDEEGSPFGRPAVCRTLGLSYASFSMALGAFYIWTHTYSLMQHASAVYRTLSATNGAVTNTPNWDSETTGRTHLLKDDQDVESANVDQVASILPSSENIPAIAAQSEGRAPWCGRVRGALLHVFAELMSPPTGSAIAGFIVGATPWLKHLFIGASAPLRVIDDSLKLLGNGTIPSVTLILGGNLLKGMRRSVVSTSLILAIISVRYVMLPVIGIGVMVGATKLNILPEDPLFAYVLMTQFTLPPAMNIATMAELFNVGQEECSVIFLWTYLAAAPALTAWSTVYLWILV